MWLCLAWQTSTLNEGQGFFFWFARSIRRCWCCFRLLRCTRSVWRSFQAYIYCCQIHESACKNVEKWHLTLLLLHDLHDFFLNSRTPVVPFSLPSISFCTFLSSSSFLECRLYPLQTSHHLCSTIFAEVGFAPTLMFTKMNQWKFYSDCLTDKMHLFGVFFFR